MPYTNDQLEALRTRMTTAKSEVDALVTDYKNQVAIIASGTNKLANADARIAQYLDVYAKLIKLLGITVPVGMTSIPAIGDLILLEVRELQSSLAEATREATGWRQIAEGQAALLDQQQPTL